ncbi:hypothetical protein GQ53DRAFT_838002 [Thozetella sp. PMI_491]|nr:hypothetical protein GQ53DRAFT_838002 [Thozetella sp. PMI_491]
MPQSEQHDVSGQRVKPRAGKACSGCHTRKVRCDVAQSGRPCTRCRADGYDCVPHSRKMRHRKGAAERGAVSPGVPTAPGPIPEHILLHKFPYYPFFRKLAAQGQDRDRGVLLPVPMQEHPNITLHADDMQFLKRKGALNLPPKAILDECISVYFRVFHPFFPVIDRPAFLSQYHQKDVEAIEAGRGPSLLLMQAIVFTSISALSTDTIGALGFSSRLEARSCFHRRARFLYEFDYESDDIVVIQTLLLISQHYPSMVEQKHTWLWVHQAIGLAQGAGLHRDSGPAPQRKLWARIWWACLARDRLITLGTGRPMHINSLDCSVPLLTPVDLEEEGDSDDDRVVKAIFVEFVRLCQYMEGVLSLPLVAMHDLPTQVDLCNDTLESWVLNLSPAARRGDDGRVGYGGSNMATLYRAVLHLVYNTVLITARQSGHILDKDRSSGPRILTPGVQHVAQDTTKLVSELMSRDLVQFCPTICVTSVLPCLVIHIQRIRSEDDPPESELASTQFRACMSFLKKLGETFWHAIFYHGLFDLATSPRAAGSGRQAGMRPLYPSSSKAQRHIERTASSQTLNGGQMPATETITRAERPETRSLPLAMHSEGAHATLPTGTSPLAVPLGGLAAASDDVSVNDPGMYMFGVDELGIQDIDYQFFEGWLDDVNDLGSLGSLGSFSSIFPSA